MAYNKGFDEECLKAVYQEYKMDYTGYEFHCTLAASRRCLKLPNHKLHTVASACGYDLYNHHNALADAEAAGIVCLHICRKFGKDLMFKK